MTTILTMCHIMSFVTKMYATCLKQLNIVIVAHYGICNWKLIIHNWKNQSLICEFRVIICLPLFMVYALPTCASPQAYFALPPSPPPPPILLHNSPILFCPLAIYFVMLLVYLIFYLLWFAPPLIAYFTMPIAYLITYFCQPLRIFIYHQFPPTLPPILSLNTCCLPISPHAYFVIMFILNLPSPSTTLCASVGMWSYWASSHLFG